MSKKYIYKIIRNKKELLQNFENFCRQLPVQLTILLFLIF